MMINYGSPRHEDKTDLVISDLVIKSSTISLAQAMVIAIVKLASSRSPFPGTITDMNVWLTEADVAETETGAIHINIDGEYDDDEEWPPSIVKVAWEMFGYSAIFNILSRGETCHDAAVVHGIVPAIEARMTTIIRDLDMGIETDLPFRIWGRFDRSPLLKNPEIMAMMAEYMSSIITDTVIMLKDETVW